MQCGEETLHTFPDRTVGSGHKVMVILLSSIHEVGIKWFLPSSDPTFKRAQISHHRALLRNSVPQSYIMIMREKEENILNMLGIGKTINAPTLSLPLYQIAFPENIIYRRGHKEKEGKILRKCEASVEGTRSGPN